MSTLAIQPVRADSTNVTRYLFVQNTDGTPATTLTHATSGLTASYTREGAAPVAITLVAGAPADAWSAGRFCAVDSTHCPGLYRLDVPDAAFALGASEQVMLTVQGTGLQTATVLCVLQLDGGYYTGELTTGATTTLLPTTGLPTLAAGTLNRRLLQFTSGPCLGERVLIVGQTAGNQLRVAPPLTVAPSDGDTFVVL